ncbi:hypothetical protein [Thalassobacillus sp. CUG 92003]|uniref:hypothetical protein n=1 Tax=Thalassobacillus sp. CUG 92003 TaxID=2736641 RepID=UPI0015E6B71A|nr:hypothetical protein [Thalassobacillus sp. CUG 92003]
MVTKSPDFHVSKQEFEEGLGRMIEKFRVLDKRISLKADDVVFTMAVSHRKEIDKLQTEILKLREEVKQLRRSHKELYLSQATLQPVKRRTTG